VAGDECQRRQINLHRERNIMNYMNQRRASASKPSKKFMKNSMTRVEKVEMFMNVMRDSSYINGEYYFCDYLYIALDQSSSHYRISEYDLDLFQTKIRTVIENLTDLDVEKINRYESSIQNLTALVYRAILSIADKSDVESAILSVADKSEHKNLTDFISNVESSD
jgi:hypothetical protein